METATAPFPVVEEYSSSPDLTPLDSEVVEVAMLLPRWQAVALQSAARQRGMTAGQFLRGLIGAMVGVQPPAPVE